MFNLTRADRRVTQDIDFDFIRYSIDEQSIKMFVDKLNSVSDGIAVFINGAIEKLHQEDYQGARIHLILEDEERNRINTKIDIGVHTYTAIEQNKIVFLFEKGNKSIKLKVNPCEQIFSEKLLSLSRLGPLSTRYKDIYDLYYLIANKLIDLTKIRNILNLFFKSSQRKPDNINELVDSIIDTLNDKNFSSEAEKPASRWIDISYNETKETIIAFISKLIE